MMVLIWLWVLLDVLFSIVKAYIYFGLPSPSVVYFLVYS